jgi:hypothetical protein
MEASALKSAVDKEHNAIENVSAGNGTRCPMRVNLEAPRHALSGACNLQRFVRNVPAHNLFRFFTTDLHALVPFAFRDARVVRSSQDGAHR